VTTPAATVATAVELLLQVPPEVPSLKLVVVPPQILAVPVIGLIGAPMDCPPLAVAELDV
jgi:hypothetical protein